MLSSICAAPRRLPKDSCARDRPELLLSAGTASCEAPPGLAAAFAPCTMVAPAAIVAAAPPTRDKKARRLERFFRVNSGVTPASWTSRVRGERVVGDIQGLRATTFVQRFCWFCAGEYTSRARATLPARFESSVRLDLIIEARLRRPEKCRYCPGGQ